MSKYTPAQYLKMIPQDAVKTCFIDAPGYNAAWDYHITPSGRHFIPACAEGAFPEYVKLYEYLPATNEMKLCFELDKSICVYNRTIRPSKVHTSMSDLPDGRLIMTTHTTANAPTHPDWMPEAYQSNLWEGFAGSNVLIYDPNTGKLEDLGIPVPRESIYGARYIPELNAMLMGGYLRGHLYLFTLDDRSVTDFGQCQEFGVYNISRGPDGNYYFATRTGELWKFDVVQRRPYYLGIEIPSETPDTPKWHVIAYSTNGPDGRMYFVSHLDKYFFAYDPKTNTIETLGHTAPAAVREDYPNGQVFGLAFDKEGKLWYTCTAEGIRICRIDIMTPGAQPEDFGLIGTERRSCFCAENTYIYDDVAYISDTNYCPGCPGVIAVDLQKLREAGPIDPACDDDGRILCQDPGKFFKGDQTVNT